MRELGTAPGLQLDEADDIARTQARVAMQERYRTLLGHFRHESGHYYWDVLQVLDPGFVTAFRAVFGDETASYRDALERHHEMGPTTDWQLNFASAYASMHPWEDWAETWAHYLHIIDTLETLQSFNRSSDILSDSVNEVKLPFAVAARGCKGKAGFAEIMELWIDASIVLNSLNRSMGLAGPLPFRPAYADPGQTALRPRCDQPADAAETQIPIACRVKFCVLVLVEGGERR